MSLRRVTVPNQGYLSSSERGQSWRKKLKKTQIERKEAIGGLIFRKM
jgi:hypothetical protein